MDTERLWLDGVDAVVKCGAELSRCPDVDAVYRRAVELARERFGVERCAIFLREGDTIHGTFGTDREGRTTDERGLAFPVTPLWERHYADDAREPGQWYLRETEHTEWDGQASVPFGRGWIASARLAFHGATVAVFVCDSALSGSAPEPLRMTLVGCYCALLGQVLHRKQAEADLVASQEQLRAVIDAMPMGMHLYRLEADEQLTFIGHNPAADRILGFDHAPRHGLPVEEALALEPGSLLPEQLRGVAHGGTPWTAAEYACRKGAVPGFYAVCAFRPGPGLVAAVFNDVTELRGAAEARRQAEELMLQAAKMDAIGRLAGGVAHAFNNLLTVISGFASFIAEELPAEHPCQPDVSQILGAAEHAAELTAQIQAFGRRQPIRIEPVALEAVLREVAASLDPSLSGSVSLEVRLPPDLPDVAGDPALLLQVFTHLLANARDAVKGAGRITVAATMVEREPGDGSAAGEVAAGRYVAVEVADDGCGMDQETRRQAFEPYFTTRGPGRGAGLGLTIVYGIVRRSGGEITCESHVGAGTTFRILLPAAAAEEPKLRGPAEPVEPPAPGQGETILVAEDEHDLRAVVERILAGAGYRVLAAASGEAALSLAAAHAGCIDLLLTDVAMPGLSGRELAERLTAERPGIPVLFMSGHAADILSLHRVSPGGTSYLQKPFGREVLLSRVRACLAAAGLPG